MVRSAAPPRWLGLVLEPASFTLVEVEQAPEGWRGGRAEQGDRAQLPTMVGGREISVALSGSEMVVRRLELPPMPTAELVEAVKWQLKDDLPFPVAEAAIGVQVVGLATVVAAAPHAILQEISAAVAQAGGQLIGVIPAPVAAWMAVATLVPAARQGTVAVIVMEAATTWVVIAHDGVICLVRDLGVGREALARALTGTIASDHGELSIDAARAEMLLRRYGVVADAESGQTEDGTPLAPLASLLRPVLEQLVTETRRVCDAYAATQGGSPIGRVWFSGEGANVPHLPEYLAQGLGVPVERGDPLGQGPQWTVALGAALDHGEGLNMLPASAGAAALAGRRRWRQAAKAAGAAAAAGWCAAWLAGGISQWQIHQQEATWRRLEPVYTQSQPLLAAQRLLERESGPWQRHLAAQPMWEGLLKEVGTLLPPVMELETLTITAVPQGSVPTFRFAMNGRWSSTTGATAGVLSGFVTALERSTFFTQVVLRRSELPSPDAAPARWEIEGLLE